MTRFKKIILCSFLVLMCSTSFGAAVILNTLWAGLLDTNGQPAAGFHVWTYTAGTNNLKTCWQDSAKGSAHPNPITLDAYGRATAYFDGNYKLIITNVASEVQQTIDNIELVSTVSPTTETITNLTVASGTISNLVTPHSTISDTTIASATISVANIVAPTISAPTISSLTVQILASASIDALTGVATGSLIFNSDSAKFQGFDGTTWHDLW